MKPVCRIYDLWMTFRKMPDQPSQYSADRCVAVDQINLFIFHDIHKPAERVEIHAPHVGRTRDGNIVIDYTHPGELPQIIMMPVLRAVRCIVDDKPERLQKMNIFKFEFPQKAGLICEY